MDFPLPSAWAVRPEFFVACCALACGLGLLLTVAGAGAARGHPVRWEKSWRNLLKAVGLIATSRSSAVAIGVSQLVTGLFLVVATSGVVLWNQPLVNTTVLLAWWNDDSREPVDIESGSTEPQRVQVEPMPVPKLAPPEVPLAGFFVEKSTLNLTASLGVAKGRHYSELAPHGGMLVGFRVTSAHPESPAQARLNSIQAIYQVGARYQLGKVMGEPGPIERESLAPAGSTIGELMAKVNRQIEALKPIFFTISEGALRGEGQEGSWLGDGSRQTQRISFRQPPVGYVASIRNHSLMSLKVLYRDEKLAALTVSNEELPAVEASQVVAVPLEERRTRSLVHTPVVQEPRVFQAPEGGILVGLKMAFSDDYWGQIEGIQPIFQRGTEYSMVHSAAEIFAKTFLAKPGFAVGGVATVGRDAVRVVYMRVLDGGRLDASDTYEEVVGGHPSDVAQRTTTSWLSDGRPAVGLRFQQTRLGDRTSYAQLALMVAGDPP